MGHSILSKIAEFDRSLKISLKSCKRFVPQRQICGQNPNLFHRIAIDSDQQETDK